MDTPLKSILEVKGASVQTTSPQTPVSSAVEQMHRQNIGALLVLDDTHLSGIFTERDVLFRVVHDGLDPEITPVAQVMTKEPFCMSPDATVKRALTEFTERRIRHLPLTEDGTLVGMLSSGDLNRWLVTQQQEEIRELADEVKKEGFKFKSTLLLVAVFIVLIIIGVLTGG